MAPAMASVRVAGEIGSALAKWTNIPDGFARAWDKICSAREPREFCTRCNNWIAFRQYADHAETHRKNLEAKEEELEMTMDCVYKKCKQPIKISKYAEHVKKHAEADEAHLRATDLQAKGLTRSKRRTRGGSRLSKGWFFVHRSKE